MPFVSAFPLGGVLVLLLVALIGCALPQPPEPVQATRTQAQFNGFCPLCAENGEHVNLILDRCQLTITDGTPERFCAYSCPNGHRIGVQ